MDKRMPNMTKIDQTLISIYGAAQGKNDKENPRNRYVSTIFEDLLLEAPPRIELGNKGFADLRQKNANR